MTGQLSIYASRLAIQSQQGPDFIDLTDFLEKQLRQCNIGEGHVLVFSRHTTACVVIQENEPLLLEDLRRKLHEIASPEEKFLHDDFGIRTENLGDTEDVNGYAHCQGLFLSQSVQVPIHDGKLALGRWQRVFFVELDCPRGREVIAQFVGVSA